MREQWQIDQGNACVCRGTDDMCPCQNVDRNKRDHLKEALRAVNEAAYAAIRAGKDTTQYPDLNREKLRQIARLTDEMVDNPMVTI